MIELPLLLFLASFALQWLAARIGVRLSARRPTLDGAERDDLDTARNVTFTLLSVIIGFSLSMSVNRYDLRQSHEEAEANAIGTEMYRLELLTSEVKAATRPLLRDYVQLRLAYYSNLDSERLRRVGSDTAQLQKRLWDSVARPAAAQATPVAALAAAGMNDVIDTEGYTDAAWRNRLPAEVWALMIFVAVGCNFLFGFGASRISATASWVLPLAASIAFLLIAEIDSPRSGFVRVEPRDLLKLAESMASTPN